MSSAAKCLTENIHDYIMDMFKAVIEREVVFATKGKEQESWNIDQLVKDLWTICLDSETLHVQMLENQNASQLTQTIYEATVRRYAQKEQIISEAGIDMREVERVVLLRSIDSHWKEHIDAMDQLRQGISLRAYANRNPVTEYQIEGFEMFDSMVENIQMATVRGLSYLNLKKEPVERERVSQPTYTSGGGDDSSKPNTVRKGAKVGRNDPCPCGSGKKYKNCCGM